jgi:hypothetical protein
MTSREFSVQRGQARVEFIALKQEIQELLLQGHTNKYIHGSLFASGRITMSYAMFCRYVIKFFPEKKREPQSRRANTPIPVKNPPIQVPVGSKTKGEESFHNKEQASDEVLETLA